MINVRLPDGRTIGVQTNDPQEAARAARRALAREAIQKSGMGAGRKTNALDQGANAAASGMTLGLSDVADGLINAGITGAKNIGLRAQGKTPTYGAADAYAAERELQREQRAKYPVTTGVSGLLGGLALPGGEQISNFVAKGLPASGVLKGILGSHALPAVVARGAIAGAPLGAGAGLTSARPGNEVSGAVKGGLEGAAVGGALPALTAGVATAAKPVRAVAKTATRAANKASGGRLLDAAETASAQLTKALKADGATPDQIRSVLNDWIKAGASSPSLMDVASKLPSGGANTLGLLRGAAMKGKGAGAASQYADKVAADLQDNAIARTRALTPKESRPAAAVRDTIEERRSTMADTDYREPYAERVAVPDTVRDALSDEPGRAALRRARTAAVARRRPDQVAEIDALLNGDGQDVTGGTLDRVRIAMSGRGAKLNQSPDSRDIAGGLFDRASDIDAALDNVPGLSEARGAYRESSRQMDALDRGLSGLNAAPDEYAAGLEGISPEARDAAGVGLRQALTDTIGRPAEGATGVLNRISSGTNVGRNLAETFGPDEASRYQDAIGNEITRLRNARHIDLTTGSQTATRLDALADIDGPRVPRTVGQWVLGLANKLQRGATLTEEERHAIVQLGIAQPDDILHHWHTDAQPIIDAISRSGGYLTAPAASQSGRH